MRRGYIDGKEVTYGIDFAKPENSQDSQRRSRIRSAIEWLRTPGRRIVVDTSCKKLLKEIGGLRCDGCTFYPSMCQLCYAVSTNEELIRKGKNGGVS